MSGILVAGNTTTHNSPFLPQRWPKPSPVFTAPSHGGMDSLRGPVGPGKYWDGDPDIHSIGLDVALLC